MAAAAAADATMKKKNAEDNKKSVRESEREKWTENQKQQHYIGICLNDCSNMANV